MVAVFSGPALVFLAVLALGVCGVCYSVRQRGALDYLPRCVKDNSHGNSAALQDGCTACDLLG